MKQCFLVSNNCLLAQLINLMPPTNQNRQMFRELKPNLPLSAKQLRVGPRWAQAEGDRAGR
nr:unnamed protein product [Callosobruchus chinensis]